MQTGPYIITSAHYKVMSARKCPKLTLTGFVIRFDCNSISFSNFIATTSKIQENTTYLESKQRSLNIALFSVKLYRNVQNVLYILVYIPANKIMEIFHVVRLILRREMSLIMFIKRNSPHNMETLAVNQLSNFTTNYIFFRCKNWKCNMTSRREKKIIHF